MTTLVLDWDGTVTERDTQWMLLERFGDTGVFCRAEEKLRSGELTHRAVMELEYETVHAPLAEVSDWLVDHVRLRCGFRKLVERHDPLILSSGFHELIEPILEREGVRARVRANRLDARPEGWRIRWTSDSECEICGEACKRGSLPRGPLIYVGDGYSDRCAALTAGRIFARDGLADFLARKQVRCEPFDDLYDVAAALS